MADLNDIDIPSITDMNTDESIELLRQIRLSRRIPAKRAIKNIKKKVKSIPKINTDQASELLNILMGVK